MIKLTKALRNSYLPAIFLLLISVAAQGQNVTGFTRVSVKVHDAKGRIISEILGIPTDTLSTAPCGRSIAIVNGTFFFRDTLCAWQQIQGSGGSSGDADSLGGELPAYYLARANHTGTQAQSTVVGLPDSISALRAEVTGRLTPEAANLLYRPISYVPSWSEVTGKPTTVSGYGITNAWTWGGNSFGAAGVIGTLDNNDLQLITNNTVRVWVGPVTGMVRINTPASIYGQLQVTGSIAAFEERIVSSSVSGNKRMVFGYNPGNFLEIAGETHAGAPGQNFYMQRNGGEILIGGLTDQGDYKVQVQGGGYWDVTGKTLRFVGIATDNTASQIMARDASGNVVHRDVTSISGSDDWGSQTVVTNTTLSGNGTSGSPLAVDVDEVLSGVGVLDWHDGGGTGDSLVIVDGDTVRIKSLEIVAGSNVTVTEEHTADKLKYTIAASTGGITDGDKGDVTVTSSGTVWTIDNNTITNAKMADNAIGNAEMADNAVGTAEVANDAITNAKLANMAESSIKGRAKDAGTGDPTDLTPTQVLDMLRPSDVRHIVQTLTDGATITWNRNNGLNAVVTLGGNRTLSITNAQAGDYGTIRVIQDGTGNRTLTLPATSFVANGGAGTIDLSNSSGSIDILTWYYDGTAFYWNYSLNFN